MFQRLKNLWDLGRFTVEEIMKPSQTYTTSGFVHVDQEELLSSTPHQEFRAATIVSMKEADPFKDFINETPEQSPDDTATGNK